MACKKCQKTVSEKERIFCRGFCGDTFHIICAKVELELLDQLGLYEKNVFWMCDHCSELFTNGHFRNIVSRDSAQSSLIPEAVDSMKADIDKLNSAVAALAAKVDSKLPSASTSTLSWPRSDRLNSNRNTPKRRRTSINSNDKPILSGTKPPSESIKTVNQNADKVWVYLSAFHPSTTNEDIASLVRDCLALDPSETPMVAKLVPKGRDPTTLNFVSFKIGVKKELRDLALSCDSWPESIQFREFEDSRSLKITQLTNAAPME
ncbi:uncharacterized protein LOC135707192 [Ochlerotatus camptorhynchus]|uniref:uncharacterized protein LOC135707192 n=1 Tax=Ochlerotatus camptorhynchus TaxID=644619 RepID=UPI0031D1FF14